MKACRREDTCHGLGNLQVLRVLAGLGLLHLESWCLAGCRGRRREVGHAGAGHGGILVFRHLFDVSGGGIGR
jgi:hypothetical protein